MTRRLIIAVSVLAALALGITIIFRLSSTRARTISVITGAVIASGDDPLLQRPIGNATVVAESDSAAGKAVSESSGLFRLQLNTPVALGETLKLQVTHPNYKPLAMKAPAADEIHVLRLKPVAPETAVGELRQTKLSNIRVRYATQSTTTTVMGAAVRTFEIVNKANVPCQGRPPCSPDGKWKASTGSLTLDAGDQQHFRNVRVSCIAGPCPFTSIEDDKFSKGGRVITVTVRNWSDPVTYLLEAEVTHTMVSEIIRYSYPVTFGRTMNFTLPASASGPSIEADVDGTQIVYPLGPQLKLSWAACRLERGPEDAKQYRCELKPGYRFE